MQVGRDRPVVPNGPPLAQAARAAERPLQAGIADVDKEICWSVFDGCEFPTRGWSRGQSATPPTPVDPYPLV
jgi:hypothetical protein